MINKEIEAQNDVSYALSSYTSKYHKIALEFAMLSKIGCSGSKVNDQRPVLESLYAGDRIVGSNPILSANFLNWKVSLQLSFGFLPQFYLTSIEFDYKFKIHYVELCQKKPKKN